MTIKFGGIRALDDISFEVLPKQIVGIIGPNGAGKTTAFNVITGAYRPSKGEKFGLMAKRSPRSLHT